MKKIITLTLLLLTSYISFSQTDIINLKAFFQGKYRLDHYNHLSWRPETQQFTYVSSLFRDSLIARDAATGKNSALLTVGDLRKSLPGKTVYSVPYYEWVSHDRLFFPSLEAIVHFHENTFKIDTLPFNGDQIIDYDVSHQLYITKENRNVFVRSALNEYREIIISTDTGAHIVFGEPVHRSEWGINEGQYISGNGNFIAFYRMDESMVEDYPLVNTTTPIATMEPMKYPMAGRTSHQVKIGIFDVRQSGLLSKPVFHYIKTETADGEFLTNVTFSPDEKLLYITHVNRSQDHAKLIEYDVLTGEKKRIVLEERDSRYVEPQTRMLFLKNNRFLWLSDRDGWKHYYLYDISGTLIRQITRGPWDVIEEIGIDPKEEYVYIITNKDDPTGRYLYQVSLKTGNAVNLSPERGTHTPFFSADFRYFIDYFTDIETPARWTLHSVKNKKSELLLNSRNPYGEGNLGKTSLFSIPNQNGDALYCRMIYPPDFDSTRQYPCLIYVYGGPHSQLVTNTFLSGGVFLHYMAQKGYVIFTLDNRGTANRGAEFEKSIHRRLGTLEMEDQMTGVRFLTSKPFIDPSRIGLDGWSYGGFMTLSLVTAYPETFRAASCGGPVVDWSWYEVMYGERYMDTPEENPEGYRQSAIIPKVKNIKCDLLVMHGAQDHTVVWQHSLELLRKAVEENIQVDYFVYPTHDHNVRGIERVHLWNKIEKFHSIHLKDKVD